MIFILNRAAIDLAKYLRVQKWFKSCTIWLCHAAMLTMRKFLSVCSWIARLQNFNMNLRICCERMIARLMITKFLNLYILIFVTLDSNIYNGCVVVCVIVMMLFMLDKYVIWLIIIFWFKTKLNLSWNRFMVTTRLS